jgi:hypothetical protein
LQEKIDRLAGLLRMGGADCPATPNFGSNNNMLDALILHYYYGQYHQVPESWCFPNCGVFKVWRQWLVGDQVQNTPPLRVLKACNVKHINLIALSEVELRRQAVTGWNANKR